MCSVVLLCFLERLLTTPIVISNNTSMTVGLAACFHDDDAFKYRAYTFTYFLVFPVAFLCNIGALVVFFMQSSRRSEHTNTRLSLSL